MERKLERVAFTKLLDYMDGPNVAREIVWTSNGWITATPNEVRTEINARFPVVVPAAKPECSACKGVGEVEIPDEYEDGGMSRSLSWHPCPRCKPAPVSGWRPTESAPRDGTLVVVVVDGYPEFARWNRQKDYWETTVRFVNPTHWLPLPPLPEVPR